MNMGPARVELLNDCTEECRPFLKSERAPYMKKQVIVTQKKILNLVMGP
jgi:hypothetical protein